MSFLTLNGFNNKIHKNKSDNKLSDEARYTICYTGSNKEPRKRGRRPKTTKSNEVGGEDQQPRQKKERRDDSTSGGNNGPGGSGGRGDPFRKPPISQLKKTGESWLQDGACFEVAPKLAKCRECRWTPHQRSKNLPQNIFCRFYAFRRLRYTKNGQLAIAGFSDPHKDASEVNYKDQDDRHSCSL